MKLTSQSKDFSKWYLELMQAADLIDYAPVKGCMIFKPYAYKIWELIQAEFNPRMEKLGVQNAYFPVLIPESFIMREADHVEGFAPELLTITRVGEKKLEEPYVVRPTSETIIYDSFSRWIHSYRDLPLKVNQWANVMRWEMKTKPFLRTSEFLWQEGHTAHSDMADADKMVMDALEMYDEFQHEVLAIEGIKGRKSLLETFPGADYSNTIEVLVKDGKSIQSCTSHNLGTSFAEAFKISYTSKEEKQVTPVLTSWGMSTRIMGTMFMLHGDDLGLRLPPKVAPYQVVIVPIIVNEETKDDVIKKAEEIGAELKNSGIRSYVDLSDKRPGFKFSEWELKGVPVRVEIGPRDLNADSLTCARRDLNTKDQIPLSNFSSHIFDLLDSIHANLLIQAQEFLQQNIIDVFDFERFSELVKERGGFMRVTWCGDANCEAKIKEKTQATNRCLSLDDTDVKGDCFHCGEKAKHIAYFAKAY